VPLLLEAVLVHLSSALVYLQNQTPTVSTIDFGGKKKKKNKPVMKMGRECLNQCILPLRVSLLEYTLFNSQEFWFRAETAENPTLLLCGGKRYSLVLWTAV
jgi:hypothetical protein